jgi:hypothetical protein
MWVEICDIAPKSRLAKTGSTNPLAPRPARGAIRRYD